MPRRIASRSRARPVLREEITSERAERVVAGVARCGLARSVSCRAFISSRAPVSPAVKLCRNSRVAARPDANAVGHDIEVRIADVAVVRSRAPPRLKSPALVRVHHLIRCPAGPAGIAYSPSRQAAARRGIAYLAVRHTSRAPASLIPSGPVSRRGLAGSDSGCAAFRRHPNNARALRGQRSSVRRRGVIA